MAHGKKEHGFGLVEIMVALAIGLFLLGGVIQIFISSKQSYRTNEALARVQEAGRFAIDVMARDVRVAGFSPVIEGCGGPVYLNLEPLPANPYPNANASQPMQPGALRVAAKCFSDRTTLDSGIEGCQGADGWTSAFGGIANVVEGWEATSDSGWHATPPVSASGGTDVITVRHSISGGGGGGVKITKHPSVNSASFEVEDPGKVLEEDEIIFVVNKSCDVGFVFQINQINDNNPRNVVHNTGNGTPGNWTDRTGGVDLLDGSVFSGLGNSQETTYYVAQSPGRPLRSLWRRIGSDPAEELVEGIEDMQITYSEDGENYVPANEAGLDWDDVIAVRISLLVASSEPNVLAETQTITYNGADVTYADRRLRQVFTTTIGLRNRLQ